MNKNRTTTNANRADPLRRRLGELPSATDLAPALFDYDAAQRYLSVSRSTLKSLAARKLITPLRIGRRTLWSKTALDRYIASLESSAV